MTALDPALVSPCEHPEQHLLGWVWGADLDSACQWCEECGAYRERIAVGMAGARPIREWTEWKHPRRGKRT